LSGELPKEANILSYHITHSILLPHLHFHPSLVSSSDLRDAGAAELTEFAKILDLLSTTPDFVVHFKANANVSEIGNEPILPHYFYNLLQKIKWRHE